MIGELGLWESEVSINEVKTHKRMGHHNPEANKAVQGVWTQLTQRFNVFSFSKEDILLDLLSLSPQIAGGQLCEHLQSCLQ